MGFAMQVRYVLIDNERDGQRIDNFLLGFLKNTPKSRVYKAIRKGEVRVNKGRVKATYRLKANDSVRIPPLSSGVIEERVKASSELMSWIEGCVLLESSDLLVLNKPPGIPVHSGSDHSLGVQEVVRKMRPKAPCVELVHRLDKGTSGCLLIAKKRSILRLLQQEFRCRRVVKHYFVLVKGRWRHDRCVVKKSLLKIQLPEGGHKVIVSDGEGAKQSVSTFKPVAYYSDATLLMVQIATGRTHQIRVHAKYMGYPVAGDDKYGCDRFNLKMKRLGLKRLFLHSAGIYFPGLDNSISFRGLGVILSHDLSEVLRLLQ